MPTLSIESNGRLEKTAVYYNGEQVGGIKELLVSIDEDGTFNTLINYEGTDKQLYTKNIFADYLTNIKIVPPSFDAEEAQALRLLTIDSDGDLNDTDVFIDDQPADGIVNLFVSIKGNDKQIEGGGIFGMFKPKKEVITSHGNFQSSITYRNEDDTLETDVIF